MYTHYLNSNFGSKFKTDNPIKIQSLKKIIWKCNCYDLNQLCPTLFSLSPQWWQMWRQSSLPTFVKKSREIQLFFYKIQYIFKQLSVATCGKWRQVSISSTFYLRLFCQNLTREKLLSYKKRARKTLMKLSKSWTTLRWSKL